MIKKTKSNKYIYTKYRTKTINKLTLKDKIIIALNIAYISAIILVIVI